MATNGNVNGNLPAIPTSADPWSDYASEANARGPIQGLLLRFTKHGEFKAGQDGEEVPEGTRLLVYMPGLQRGWVKWEDQKPVRHIIGLVAEGYRPPPRSELGDMDQADWPMLNGRPIDPWQNTNYVTMLDEGGQIYTFVTASKGGLSALGELVDQYAKRRRMKPDEIPVIELHARSYQHKEYGETFAPQLKITGWAGIPENFTELASAMEPDGDEGEGVPFQLSPPPAQTEELSAPAPAPAPAKRPPGRPPNATAPKAAAAAAAPAAKATAAAPLRSVPGGKRPVKF
jgi:hypothetical protein